VGGLAFLIRDGENGFHVPSRNPEALAERIYELLTHEACIQKLGQNARKYAQQYAWNDIAEKMLGVYGALLAPRAATKNPRGAYVENPL
jgi:D-inositol-3-phosphate glycosyltransferase